MTEAAVSRVQTVSTTFPAKSFPWVPLASRLVLFAVVQGLIALGLWLSGTSSPWGASAPWWPVSATVTSLVSLGLLARSAKAVGSSPAAFLGVDGSRLGRDFAIFLGVVVLAGPIAMVPNIGLATLLFGDAQLAVDTFVRPLPTGVAMAILVAFPLAIALTELPTYYVDALHRLEARGWSRWQAVLVAAAFHSAQHATLPLIFDARFIVWRLLMFLPFAIYVGVIVQRRPSLLPWLMAFHALIDFSVAWQVWAISR